MSKKTSNKKSEKPEESAPVVVDHESVILKLKNARIGLIIRQPFFGQMTQRLHIVHDDSIETAATDGRNFIYNAEFIQKLQPKEVEFLFGHEVLHNVFEHHYRKGNRFHKLWNIACDYVINDILVLEKIGEKIHTVPILHDEKYRGWTSEEVYDDLMKNIDKLDVDQLCSMLLDKHIDTSNMTEEEKEAIRKEIKEGLLSSAQQSGKLPAGVDRLVNQFLEPKINWKDKLNQNIQSLIKSDYSFIRPNKKLMQSGFILPGLKREQALDVVVAIDMSGSISDKIAQRLLSEVRGIMDQYNDYNIHVYCFDTEVHNPQSFSSDNGDIDDINDYKCKGGGGTLYECCFEYMKKEDIQPLTFIMLTDMYPNSGWGDPDYCDTIFCAYGTTGIVAPFGETIEIGPDDEVE